MGGHLPRYGLPSHGGSYVGNGRIWAKVVRRGSYTSLFLLNSGHSLLENKGTNLNFGSRTTI